MKGPAFDSTPDFQHFKKVMKGVLAVPKERLDELVRAAKEDSPRKGNGSSAGKKKAPKRRKVRL